MMAIMTFGSDFKCCKKRRGRIECSITERQYGTIGKNVSVVEVVVVKKLKILESMLE